jgi:broad specificity phosphatase PhoE
MARTVLLTTVLSACLVAPAVGQSVVLVRHAERADTAAGGAPTMAADPDLSDAGRARARRLADMLRDAGIAAIFVTEYKRTQQTAAPLAAALGLTPVVIKAAETKALITRIRAVKGHALVVGHSNTVPEVAAALAGAPPITIADGEYDNLLVVSRSGKPRLMRLRY